MDKKRKRYSAVQDVLILLMFLPIALFSGHRMSLSHGSALLSLAAVMIGGVGTIVMIVLKNLLPQGGQSVTNATRKVRCTEVPEGDRVVWGAVDRTTSWDFWRCSVILLAVRWQTYLMILPPVQTAIVILAFLASRMLLAPGTGVALILLLARVLFIGHRIWRKYQVFCHYRYPRSGDVRTCTTTLTRMGYLNVTAKFETFSPWADVGAIREFGSDIYIFHVDGGGIYVTRNAFRDRSEAHEFKQKALELWGNPMPLPESMLIPTPTAAYQADVWPPPPQE